MLAVVQARSSSSRLPGKVMRPLLGVPMILRELERVSRSRKIDHMVLATSRERSDDALASVCMDKGYDVFRGALDDVLDRYYQCAKRFSPDYVVRLTGDCPVIDWRLADAAIEWCMTKGCDYTSLTEQYPDGLDVEVVRFAAIETAWQEARLPSEREHVTQFIVRRPERFHIERMDSAEDWSAMRWTVDEPEDFAFITKIYEALYPLKPDFTMQDILTLLSQRPEFLRINAGFIRNEGLLKSLEEDRRYNAATAEEGMG